MKTLTVKDKERKLEQLKRKMKSRFRGVDSQIDKLVDSIYCWYVNPELQKKPTIVNLWGLTGVGKSSMIKYLIGELGFNSSHSFVTMDPGTKKDKYDGALSDHIPLKVKNTPFILVLDEFQKYKTIDEKGCLEKNIRYPELWNLLSDGSLIDPTLAIRVLTGLMDNMLELKIKLIKELRKYTEDYQPVSSGYDLDESPIYAGNYNTLTEFLDDDSKTKSAIATYFKLDAHVLNKLDIPFSKILDELYKLAPDSEKPYIHTNWDYKLTSLQINLLGALVSSVNKRIQYSWEDLYEMCKKDILMLKEKDVQEKITYNKLLVIIAGNQDELYSNSHSLYLSYKDVELLYDETKDYKWYQLKPLLLRSLAPEHISRLGVNHIMFPSINKKAYKQIIKDRADDMINSLYKEFGCKMSFTDKVFDVIYKNSVFPAQGVRPVLSFMDDILKPTIIKHLINSKKNGKIVIDVDDKKSKLIITSDSKKHEYSIVLEVSERESTLPEENRISIAVHEAGHALISMFLWDGISTVDMAPMIDGALGCTSIVPNEKLDNAIGSLNKFYRSNICSLVAGKAAEELVFGYENLSSGCSQDLRQASSLVYQMIRHWGLNSNVVSSNSSSYVAEYTKTTNTEQEDLQGEYIVNEEYERAKEIIRILKPVFIEMVEYLRKNVFMTRDVSKLFLKKVKDIRSSNSLSSYSEKRLWNKYIGK